MAKNYMTEVAKMLGVELDEEFTIPNNAVILKISAKDGLMYKFKGDGEWESGASDLQYLLIGEFEIIKLPWKPAVGMEYWHPDERFMIKLVAKKIWQNDLLDRFWYDNGICHRTRKEAEEHFAEDYKKLTGEELE